MPKPTPFQQEQGALYAVFRYLSGMANATQTRDRYLEALKLDIQPPTLAYLRRLIAAHQRLFPYESISKLLLNGRGLNRIPTLDEFLRGNGDFGFGGTCFPQNGYFTQLLQDVGFDADLVGVKTNGQEDHVSRVVNLPGGAWRVDLGLMSKFAALLPLSGPPIEQAENHRILRYFPMNDGLNYRFEIWRNGEIRRRLESIPGSRTLASLEPTIARSFAIDAIFLKTICVYKVIDERELSIWNNEFHVSSGMRSTSRTIADLKEMQTILHNEMELPGLPIADAVQIIRERHAIDVFSRKTDDTKD